MHILPLKDPLCLSVLYQLMIVSRTQKNIFWLKERQQSITMNDLRLGGQWRWWDWEGMHGPWHPPKKALRESYQWF